MVKKKSLDDKRDPLGLLKGRSVDDILREGNASLGGSVSIKYRGTAVKAPRAPVEAFVEQWRGAEDAESIQRHRADGVAKGDHRAGCRPNFGHTGRGTVTPRHDLEPSRTGVTREGLSDGTGVREIVSSADLGIVRSHALGAYVVCVARMSGWHESWRMAELRGTHGELARMAGIGKTHSSRRTCGTCVGRCIQMKMRATHHASRAHVVCDLRV